MNKNELLDAIVSLLPGQFDVFTYKLKVPIQFIPSPQAPQASRAVELLRYLEGNGRLPDAIALIEEVTESPAAGQIRWPVIPTATTLLNHDGSPVIPNVASLIARPRGNFASGSSELWNGIEESLVRYDIGNYGRKAQWPLAFKSTEFSRGPASWKWRRAYRVAENVEIEEQFLVDHNGILAFQRATAWRNEHSPIEFAPLCADTVCFLRFAGRLFTKLAGTERNVPPELDIRCELKARVPALALFSEVVFPVDHFRSAWLRKTPIEAKVATDSSLLSSNAGHVCDMSKKLINRIAGQFEVEPGEFLATGRPFLEVEGKSFSELALRLSD